MTQANFPERQTTFFWEVMLNLFVTREILPESKLRLLETRMDLFDRMQNSRRNKLISQRIKRASFWPEWYSRRIKFGSLRRGRYSWRWSFWQGFSGNCQNHRLNQISLISQINSGIIFNQFNLLNQRFWLLNANRVLCVCNFSGEG